MRKIWILFLVLIALSFPILVYAQASTPIRFDEVLTGEITEAKPSHQYTFEGKAGDIITIAMTAIRPGLDTYLQLSGPHGEQFANDDSSGTPNSLLFMRLPSDGTYTLSAASCCGGAARYGSTGAYELLMQKADVQTITAGETVELEASDTQPHTYLLFEGETERAISLHAERISGDAAFVVEVRNPAGQTINSAAQTEDGTVTLDPLILNVDGDYLLLVSRQLLYPESTLSGASVHFSLTLDEIEAAPVVLGETMSGILTDEKPVDYFTFSGRQDEVLRFAGSRTSGSEDVEILVYTERGSVFVGSSTEYSPLPDTFILDPLQLAETGQYLVLIHRPHPVRVGDSETTGYSFTLGASETPLLENGVEVRGSFSDALENIYRYQGSADETVRITLESLSQSYAPGLSIQGPKIPGIAGPEGTGTNFYLFTTINTTADMSYEMTLPADGVYLFHLSNAGFNPSSMGEEDFSLRIDVVK